MDSDAPRWNVRSRRLTIPGLLLSCILIVLGAAQPPAGPAERTIFDNVPAAARARYEADAIRLWDGRAPDARGDAAEDVPVLYPLLPAPGGTSTGAILVLAGGAYTYHAAPEAFPIAERYRQAGLAAFVLKYRLLPRYDPLRHPLADAQRAVRVIRARAREWHVDPNRIAAIGFSAGGHLAAHLSLHGDDGSASASDPIERQNCRVQTVVLIYPALLPPDLPYPRPDRSMAALLAAQGLHRLVDARTPPTFLLVGYDDTRAPYDHCLAYAAALHEKGVRFELHILGRGEHGASVRDERSAAWTTLALDWLQSRGVAAVEKAGP
jgi:acetyl esterase/lipase